MKLTSDWWRHLGAQVALAAALGALAMLGKYDWSALGPFAAVAPVLVGLAAEGVNQYLAPLAK